MRWWERQGDSQPASQKNRAIFRTSKPFRWSWSGPNLWLRSNKQINKISELCCWKTEYSCVHKFSIAVLVASQCGFFNFSFKLESGNILFSSNSVSNYTELLKDTLNVFFYHVCLQEKITFNSLMISRSRECRVPPLGIKNLKVNLFEDKN